MGGAAPARPRRALRGGPSVRAAPSASRYVSRASSASSGSSRCAARRNSFGAALPRRRVDPIRARRRSARARSSSSSVPRSAVRQQDGAPRRTPPRHARPARRREPVGAEPGVTRERHGALEERRCRGQPAASLGTPGRALELGGHRVVRPGGGLRPMPRAPVRIDGGVGLLRQRLDAPRGGRPSGRRGRRPSARADAGIARGFRVSPGRRPSSSRPPSASIPSRRAARHSSDGSPTGSAAAISSSRRAAVGKLLEPALEALARSGWPAAGAPAARSRRRARAA